MNGYEAWAGLGWTQDRTGKGLFVELHDSSESLVRESIRSTLQSMIANRNDDYGPIYEKVIGIQCIDQPVCAVVIAVYESQGWNYQTSYEC